MRLGAIKRLMGRASRIPEIESAGRRSWLEIGRLFDPSAFHDVYDADERHCSVATEGRRHFEQEIQSSEKEMRSASSGGVIRDVACDRGRRRRAASSTGQRRPERRERRHDTRQMG